MKLPVNIDLSQDGTAWVCGEYDHGVFCRLCTHVTDPTMLAVVHELVALRKDGDA